MIIADPGQHLALVNEQPGARFPRIQRQIVPPQPKDYPASSSASRILSALTALASLCAWRRPAAKVSGHATVREPSFTGSREPACGNLRMDGRTCEARRGRSRVWGQDTGRPAAPSGEASMQPKDMPQGAWAVRIQHSLTNTGRDGTEAKAEKGAGRGGRTRTDTSCET